MVTSDILLDDEGIELVPADGSVDVSTDRDETPGIRLAPRNGAIQLGADSGIVLADDVAFPPNQSDNTVFVTGVNDHGLLMLGKTGEERARVTLDGLNSQLTLGGQYGTGDILAYKEGLIESLLFTGQDATLRVGGTDTDGNGVPGAFRLRNAVRDTATVDADAGPADTDGGTISVAEYTGATTIDLAGGSGHVTLGNGAASGGGVAGSLSLVDTDDTETISLDGATGAISGTSLDVSEGLSVAGGLDLGNGIVLDVDNDGVLSLGDPASGKAGLKLDPATGTFGITDADGDTVFEVDTQARSVNTAKGYSRGTIEGTEPGGP